jgi:hypothetical protein
VADSLKIHKGKDAIKYVSPTIWFGIIVTDNHAGSTTLSNGMGVRKRNATPSATSAPTAARCSGSGTANGRS